MIEQINTLHYLLLDRDENGFIDFATKFVNPSETHHLNTPVDKKTLLQEAAEKNLVNIVKFLLEKGVDANVVTEETKQTPAEIAATNGYDNILDLLLTRASIENTDNILPNILKHYETKTKNSNYKRCFDVWEALIGVKKVNCKDESGNFPLHYASKLNDASVALHLLKLGASLANKNNFGVLTIKNVTLAILKQHFDRCIEEGTTANGENTIISYNYLNLMPSETEDNALLLPQPGKHQMEAVLFISETKRLRPLLHHPLILSFLYLKDFRFKKIYRANTVLYSLLYLLMFFYASSWGVGFENFVPFISVLLQYVLSYVTIIVTTLFLVKKIFQIILLRGEFFMKFKNYVDVTLYCIFMFILTNDYSDSQTKRITFIFLTPLWIISVYITLSSNPNVFSDEAFFSLFYYVDMLQAILRGVPVSDLQQVKIEAQFYPVIRKVQYLATIETIIIIGEYKDMVQRVCHIIIGVLAETFLKLNISKVSSLPESKLEVFLDGKVYLQAGMDKNNVNYVEFLEKRIMERTKLLLRNNLVNQRVSNVY